MTILVMKMETIVTMMETGMLEGPKSAGVWNYLCKVGKVFD